jgi:hypothetical protein
MTGGGNGAARADETVVSAPTFDRAVVWLGLPALGALAGWLLKLVASWVADLPRVPFRPVFTFIASIDEPYATVGALVLGAALGVVVAVIAEREALTVTVSGWRARLARGDGTATEVSRSDVDSVFMDGKNLVLLHASGGELARESTDLRPDALREAFTRHGYRWLADGDPHADDFRLWVDDMPGLPEGADALLKARARALEKRRDRDAAELRRELGRLGVVIRDERRRQYWRMTPPRIGA